MKGLSLVRGFLLLWVIASVVWLCAYSLPGDPALMILGEQASAESIQELHDKLGSSLSPFSQYTRFLQSLVGLGEQRSLIRPDKEPWDVVALQIGPTAELAGLAVAIGACGGILAALFSIGPWLGKGRDWVHRGIILAASLPLLSYAPVLTYVVAVRFRLVPLPGDPDAGFLALLWASALLAVPLGAQVARMSRSSLLEQTKQRYMTVARIKGGSWARVWLIHALPAAAGPILVVVATQLGALLGGAVVLERLFERPGLGSLILSAYAERDLPVLQVATVASAGLFIVAQAMGQALMKRLEGDS